jgi:hypothetical protein
LCLDEGISKNPLPQSVKPHLSTYFTQKPSTQMMQHIEGDDHHLTTLGDDESSDDQDDYFPLTEIHYSRNFEIPRRSIQQATLCI